MGETRKRAIERWMSVLLAAVILFGLVPGVVVSAAQPISVVLDGKVLEFDVPPQMINDRTMVPMRVIFEALGADIEWDGATRTVTATKDDLIVRATIGDVYISVNGVRTAMDVAPVIVNDRTLVPVRFVSEAFGADVDWYAGGRTVYITSSLPDDFISAEEP